MLFLYKKYLSLFTTVVIIALSASPVKAMEQDENQRPLKKQKYDLKYELLTQAPTCLQLSLKNFPPYIKHGKTNQVPSLQTLLCWNYAQQCKSENSFNCLKTMRSNLQEDVVKMYCLGFDTWGATINGLPPISIKDLQKYCLVLHDIQLDDDTQTNDEIIAHLVACKEFDALEELFDVYLDFPILSKIFNPYAILIDYLKSLEQHEIKSIFEKLDENQESTLKMACRLLNAKKYQEDIDAFKCVSFLQKFYKVNHMNQYRVSYKTHEELLFGCGVFINEPNPLLTDITINYILPLLEPLLEKEVVDLNICIANAGHLSVCPRSLGMLQNLKVLNFYGANFKTLPESIGLLSKLVCLELCHSKISELPNSFNNLKQLRRLDLTNNQFQTLPPCISSFKNLHTLILFGTPITELSDDLILELPKECTIFMKESVQISQSFCEHFVVKHNYN